MGRLYGSTTLAGTHFAGEEYCSGFPGESVRGRSWCRVARQGGDAAGGRRRSGLGEAARCCMLAGVTTAATSTPGEATSRGRLTPATYVPPPGGPRLAAAERDAEAG